MCNQACSHYLNAKPLYYLIWAYLSERLVQASNYAYILVCKHSCMLLLWAPGKTAILLSLHF